MNLLQRLSHFTSLQWLMLVGTLMRQLPLSDSFQPRTTRPYQPSVYGSPTVLDSQNHPLMIKAITTIFSMTTISSSSSIDQNSKEATSVGVEGSSALQLQQQQQQQQQHVTSNPSNNRRFNQRPRSYSSSHHESPKCKIKSMFKQAQEMERSGRWRQAALVLRRILDLDPHDAHSHLALARLEARREQQYQWNDGDAVPPRIQPTDEVMNNATTIDATTNSHALSTDSKAQKAFREGTTACPNSVHLWQAWAVYEESRGNLPRARQLFEQALELDAGNPYVCHAYGLMEKKLGNSEKALQLWEDALQRKSTAALVCSLGELLISQKELKRARDLYGRHVLRLATKREMTEVYLASAWLEERYFSNFDRAEELINLALIHSPSSSLAHVALARLEGRRSQRARGGDDGNHGKEATVRRLANACVNIAKGSPASPSDGRLFNAWAHFEVKSRRLTAARKILRKGMENYPRDPSLFQAAGKVEERVGNYSGARELYSASLHIAPSAPALVAFALLELNHPESEAANYTKVKRLFEEALLLDPRHGPAYNAYGTAEWKQGNVDAARRIYERGVRASCSDAASLYHGYAMLELAHGNVDTARDILISGQKVVRCHDVGMDSPHRERALFLTHTLGMVELKCDRAMDALAVFNDGIERYGNSSQLLLGAALCEVKLGREDTARILFERSVHADTKHAQAWHAWGIMEMRAGSMKAAKTLFECGIKSSPRYGGLWQVYGHMEGKLGNYETARVLFAAGIQKSPTFVPLYRDWAAMELQNGNITTAKRLISEALTRDKRQGSGWLIASQIEEQLGNDGLVGLILRRGIECAPADVELYRALGEHLMKKGKINDAREIFEKGLDVNPLHAPLYHSLAELEAQVFNLDALARLNRQASKLFNRDSSTPASSLSSRAWAGNLRARRFRDVPRGVSALAQKIVDNEDGGLPFISGDPIAALENLQLLASDVVGDIFNMD